MFKNKIIFLNKRVNTLVNMFFKYFAVCGENNISLQLEQPRGLPFLNNGMNFTILQRFGNSPFVMERFTKYDIQKNKPSAQFFSIGVSKLLGPDDLLLEKDLMILVISSEAVGQK